MVHYPSQSASKFTSGSPESFEKEYVVQFIGSGVNKTVRLWYFPFDIEKQELIVQAIRNFGGVINRLKIVDLPHDTEVRTYDYYKNKDKLFDSG